MTKLNNFYSERLILSSECNFKCAYCYQKEKKHQLLSREVAEKRIAFINDYMSKHPDDRVCINLFGGEPLLNWDVFKFIVDTYYQNRQVYLSTITNGSCLTDDKVRYLKDKYLGINVSLDGTEMANLMRTGVNKKQSYPIVINAMKKLIDQQVEFTVALTIGRNNQNFVEQSLIFLKELGVRSVNLQFMNYNSYKIKPEQLEKILKIAEKLNTKDFVLNIGLLKEDSKDCSLYRNDENPVMVSKWTHTQADGFSYDFLGCVGVGLPDYAIYSLHEDFDFSKTKVLSYCNNLTGATKEIHKVEDLL